MSKSEQKVVRYLNEAHASEVGLVSVLRSQIAMTPRGSYRDGLEKHLDETRTHAQRIHQRLGEFGQGRNPVQVFVGFAETLISQSLALGRTPFDLLRGSGGEEKVLKNAKDACATEALEIATYTALERLATRVGDEQTAKLAAWILGDEERMLERIMREIPKLSDAVVGADVDGKPFYDITKTGAADAARGIADEVKQATREIQSRAKRTARQARQVPGVAQIEGQIKGAVASEGGSRHPSL
jgi:ferritin-like metal-binding protein YciE